MKIDAQTMIPVGWVMSGIAAVVTMTIVVAFWVSSVNYRLSRIEEKLGIPAYTQAQIQPDARAGQ